MMKNGNLMRLLFLAAAAPAALTVTGCDEDAAPTRPAHRRAALAAPSVAPSVALAPPPAEPDPLAAPDGLASDGLTPAGGPLTDVGDPLASPTGPRMPTAHSHWLRGRIFDARVAVRLNGMYLGEFSALVDKDITMRLHAGVNTVAFTARPLGAGATARLDLVESEHTPPVPPLATFRMSPEDRASPRPADQATQVETFLAR